MRVIEPRQFKHLRPIKKKRSYKSLVLISLLTALFCIGVIRYNRPLPELEYRTINALKPGSKAKFTWPQNEQAAIGIIGQGVVASNNSDSSVPTASTIKILTALMVMNKKPLKVGEQGPNIEITKQDQQIYDNVYINEGSRVLVQEGSVLTQKQALQALLLPSANNIAETLTNWAFGSQQEYLVQTKKWLEKNNLSKTIVADSSGFSPDTKSTAREIAIIAELAISNPVIAEIVSQKQADIPVAGVISNTNWLLGKSGIDGVKTGHTDQSGGCFIVSANINLKDKKVAKVYGVILGAADVDQAMVDIQPLALEQVLENFKENQVITKGQKLGTINSAWGESALLIADSDLRLYGWTEETPKISLNVKNKDIKSSNVIGEAKLKLGESSGDVKIVRDHEISEPSFWWRFKRIFQ